MLLEVFNYEWLLIQKHESEYDYLIIVKQNFTSDNILPISCTKYTTFNWCTNKDKLKFNTIASEF